MEVLRDALTLLSRKATAEREDDINRDLLFCIAEATHAASGNGPALPPIVYEGRSPPSASDQARAAREFKVPDFQWGLTDHHATDPKAAFKHFVIECKRLAPSTRRDWVYTEQYVRNGILRFISPEHGYGKGMASGAMVGYLQGLSIDTAHTEINAHAAGERIPPLEFSARDGEEAADLEHRLDRPFEQAPYRLLHLWVRVNEAP